MENTMKNWKECVAKTANHNFEYFSNSQDKWMNLEEMNESHLMNVIKLVLREDGNLPFRVTYLDPETHKPVGGRYVSLIMEPCNK